MPELNELLSTAQHQRVIESSAKSVNASANASSSSSASTGNSSALPVYQTMPPAEQRQANILTNASGSNGIDGDWLLKFFTQEVPSTVPSTPAAPRKQLTMEEVVNKLKGLAAAAENADRTNKEPSAIPDDGEEEKTAEKDNDKEPQKAATPAKKRGRGKGTKTSAAKKGKKK